MSKITGIGGVFLKQSHDEKRLLKWYRDVLGLEVSAYGINLLEPNESTLITFSRESENQAVLNFTVDDLDDFVSELKAKGVEIHKEIQNQSFGKFARIKDGAGNIIELCQLDKEEYRAMTQKEIKQFNK